MNDLIFWAKLGQERWPEKYHPVVCHLVDVGQVAHRLWADVFGKQVKHWVMARLGLPDEITACNWLTFWAAAHDIGKVCPGFQVLGDDPRTTALAACLPGPEWDYPTGTTPHGTISAVIFDQALREGSGWPAVDRRTAMAISIAIGGHHGVFPTNAEYPSHIGNTRWKNAQARILKELARLFKVTDLAIPNPPHPDDQSVWMFLAGLTSVADWIGSNTEFFRSAGSPGLARTLGNLGHLRPC